eukprot:1142759-Pelagomonas_calceolata.AAC.3
MQEAGRGTKQPQAAWNQVNVWRVKEQSLVLVEKRALLLVKQSNSKASGQGPFIAVMGQQQIWTSNQTSSTA